MSALANPEAAVEAGKSALRDRWDYNWYDRASDDIGRINVRAPYDWSWLDDWANGSGSGDWFPNWNWSELFATLGWITIGILLAVVAYLLVRAYLESERGRRMKADSTAADPHLPSPDRIEALPISIRNPTGDFLEEARKHYQAGNLAEAIIYLFSYQLIQLDRHHLLRLTKGKTNRQYLREVRRSNPQVISDKLAGLLRQTMMLFEASFFGGKEPPRSQFDACWSELGRFQSLLASTEPVPVNGNKEPSTKVAANTTLTLLAIGLVVFSGCGPQLRTEYGRRTGSGASSINGTTVLAEMFSDAGHDVGSWTALSPALQEADVIVWAPDDFDMPPQKVQDWLNDWLLGNYDEKTLIYIGRDFDATPGYWSWVQQNAPPEQQKEVSRRLREAKSDFASDRSRIPDSAEWPDWFTIDSSEKREDVTSLSGPWSEGVDASKIEIERNSRITPNEHADVLLATGSGDALISETEYSWLDEEYDQEWQEWDESYIKPSKLIIVENGSFLLNLPLVNHEHRKIAGKLVEHVGPPGKRVVFLQSSAGGPAVRDTDTTQNPSGLALFGIWPLSGVLAHLAILGLVYAVARWPIFGVPKELPPDSLTDFGAHVDALGQLLQETRNSAYARTTLLNYRHMTTGDDG